jgi:arylsulfatase A-like enzyme
LLPLVSGAVERLREAVFTEESYVQRKAALRTDRYKYIQALDETGWCRYCEKVHVGLEELYDLKKDPRELTDVSESRQDVAQQLRAQLHEIIAHLDRKRTESQSRRGAPQNQSLPNLQPEDEQIIKKRLKSLGYLSD